VQEFLVAADGQAPHVLEDEELGSDVRHEAHEVVHEVVARVIERALPDEAEALARSAAAHHVNIHLQGRPGPDVCAIDVRNASANDGRIREVEFVGGRVDGVVFDGRPDIEPGPFETEAHPARARKKIDGNRPALHG
jgi:hypothetical protein